MEIDKVILEFRVKSTPSDEYTAIGYSIGDTVKCTLEQYRKDKDTLSLILGQGDGAVFKKDELEVIGAVVFHRTFIDDPKVIEDNFLK